MIKRIKRYISTTVTPIDLVMQRHNASRLKIGWCSVFPPTLNGVASVTYHFLKKLMLYKDIDTYAIPLGGRIDKGLFNQIKFANLNSKYLDAVVFFCLGPSIESALKKTYAKKIAWQTAHESIINDSEENKLFEYLKKADLILTLTKGTLFEYRKGAALKVDYVPAGVDTSKFIPTKKSYNQVLFASRVHYYKGVVSYLEAIPLVLRINRKIKFRLHGPIDKNTNYLSEISELLDKIKREFPDNFIYDGNWVDYEKIQSVYDGSDIFVFPSDNEGFGVPMVEAMSCGMPCIVADKPPMNEIVRNNETGFCLPLRKGIEEKYYGYRFPHPEDIAQKILWLVDNPAELMRMGDNARAIAKAEYNIDDCIDKMVEVIKKVVTEK